MRDALVQVLEGLIPHDLAAEITDDYIVMRRDLAAGLPGRAAPGKFVESFVQVLQYLAIGAYDEHPSVDRTLQSLEGASALSEGLRLCAARIARSMYTLRNKRGIVHKGEVDPNEYDLDYLHSAAQWVMAELVRTASGVSVAEASALVRQIRSPVGGVVEDFGEKKLVLAELPLRDEVLVLLHSEYPRAVPPRQISESMDRSSPRAVLTALQSLWKQRYVEGARDAGYTLTRKGLREAAGILRGML